MPQIIKGSINELISYHSQIARLVSSYRQTNVTIDQLAKEVAPDAIYHILIIKKQVIGVLRYFKVPTAFLTGHRLPKKYKSYYQIASVIINSTHRGKGYGSLLLTDLLSHSKNKFILDTYISWLPAVKLYLSTGFIILTTTKTKNDYLVVFIHQ